MSKLCAVPNQQMVPAGRKGDDSDDYENCDEGREGVAAGAMPALQGALAQTALTGNPVGTAAYANTTLLGQSFTILTIGTFRDIRISCQTMSGTNASNASSANLYLFDRVDAGSPDGLSDGSGTGDAGLLGTAASANGQFRFATGVRSNGGQHYYV